MTSSNASDNDASPQRTTEASRTAADPEQSHPPSNTVPQKRVNAFTELMSTKKPKPAPTAEDIGPTNAFDKVKTAIQGLDPRRGLSIYIDRPEANPEGRVVGYDDDFVLIKDKFPKASVHMLLLPRKPEYYNAHPLHKFSSDPEFLADVRRRVERVKQLAASELRRQFGHGSASDAEYQVAYEEVMSAPDPPTEEQLASLPKGRDWIQDIEAGVHTHPSMSHLHIHVFSKDMQSPCLKHKKHYLSFTSSFLVKMEEFPLEDGSERFHPGDWPKWDMKCWRCGTNYKNKFAKLKEHLEDEFEEWKKE